MPKNKLEIGICVICFCKMRELKPGEWTCMVCGYQEKDKNAHTSNS